MNGQQVIANNDNDEIGSPVIIINNGKNTHHHHHISLPTSAPFVQVSLASSDYPPSPPAVNEQKQIGCKALTIANVAALPSSFGSSNLSTSPISDEDDSSSSELSFSTTSSSEAPPSVASVDETRFLSSVFGPTYLSEFGKYGVKVVALPEDIVDELPTPNAAILSSPAHDTKTLYYLASSNPSQLDREALVDLMELADEDLECNGIVICLDRKNCTDKEELAETLHSLMYVGGAIVAPDSGMVAFNSEDYILVGLDL